MDFDKAQYTDPPSAVGGCRSPWSGIDQLPAGGFTFDRPQFHAHKNLRSVRAPPRTLMNSLRFIAGPMGPAIVPSPPAGGAATLGRTPRMQRVGGGCRREADECLPGRRCAEQCRQRWRCTCARHGSECFRDAHRRVERNPLTPGRPNFGRYRRGCFRRWIEYLAGRVACKFPPRHLCIAGSDEASVKSVSI
jgi:hypothetical protein